jgi:phosphate/phosphite/phosphonate ABC transporter binding protein
MAIPTTYAVTYYPWITQNIDVTEIHKNIEALLSIVTVEYEKITGKQVQFQLQKALEVPKQIQSIVDGDSQIAFMNPLGFAFAKEQSMDKVKALSVVEREINGQWGTTYYAQLYTNKRTAITQGNFAEKLKGRAIGFGTAVSTSNFLIPAFELLGMGIKLLPTFARIEFIGGHEKVAMAVYDGKIDIGAGHDGVISDLSNQYGYGDATEKLVTLHKSKEIPSDPIAININDSSISTSLQKSFEAASKTTSGEKAIKKFWGNGRYLLTADSDKYNYLLEALKQLGLTRKDIIGT